MIELPNHYGSWVLHSADGAFWVVLRSLCATHKFCFIRENLTGWNNLIPVFLSKGRVILSQGQKFLNHRRREFGLLQRPPAFESLLILLRHSVLIETLTHFTLPEWYSTFFSILRFSSVTFLIFDHLWTQSLLSSAAGLSLCLEFQPHSKFSQLFYSFPKRNSEFEQFSSVCD